VALCLVSSGFGIELPGFARRWAAGSSAGYLGSASTDSAGWKDVCVVIDAEATSLEPQRLVAEIYDLRDSSCAPFAFEEV
jgi:hypothetical protein